MIIFQVTLSPKIVVKCISGCSLEPWVCKSHNQMVQISLSPWLPLYLNMKAINCLEEVFIH